MSKLALPKILIIQRIVPECRKDFFNGVFTSAHNKFFLKLISSNQATGEGHKLVEIPNNHKLVRSFYFKGLIHFQFSFIELIRHEYIVMEHAINSLSNLINIMLIKLLRKKLILWGHGARSHLKESWLKRIVKKLILNSSDYYIGYTELSRKTLQAANYPENRIHIINNSSIETHEMHRDLDCVDKFSQGIKFIFCGRLTRQKKLDKIFSAFEAYSKDRYDSELHIIGDGPEMNKLIELGGGNDNIFFHGSLFETERDHLMSMCHVQIIPDHVGLSILQGFSLGLPLITSKDGMHCPEIEYFLDRKNGLYYSNFDKKSLISVMHSISNFDIWRKLSIGATETAARYPLSNMTDSFIKALGEFSKPN